MMRIFFASDLKEELKEPKENTIFLREKNGKIICESENLSLTTSHDLERVLHALADLGYESIVLDINMTKLPEWLKAREIKTLQNLIEEVKKGKGSELCGAIGVFVGFVRKISGSKEVVRLEYEAYEPVFSEKVKEIEKRLKDYPGVEGVRIFHKIGVLKPGEDIVYVVVMGRHRRDLWKPLTESMEIVKKELPIWKKEVYKDGEAWVHDLEESQKDDTIL